MSATPSSGGIYTRRRRRTEEGDPSPLFCKSSNVDISPFLWTVSRHIFCSSTLSTFSLGELGMCRIDNIVKPEIPAAFPQLSIYPPELCSLSLGTHKTNKRNENSGKLPNRRCDKVRKFAYYQRTTAPQNMCKIISLISIIEFRYWHQMALSLIVKLEEHHPPFLLLLLWFLKTVIVTRKLHISKWIDVVVKFNETSRYLDVLTTFQLLKLLCLTKDHWLGFSTRNAHMVHIVN